MIHNGLPYVGSLLQDSPIVSEHVFELQVEIAVGSPVAVLPSTQQAINSKQKILLSKEITDP